MKYMETLEKNLCKELEEMSHKPMSQAMLDPLYTITATLKNILKIDMLMQAKEEYGDSYDDGMSRSYDRGDSYRGRGRHYVRGHYSRDDGYSHDDYSNDGYSRHDAKEVMIGNLEKMMQKAGSEKEKEAIRKCISQLENS